MDRPGEQRSRRAPAPSAAPGPVRHAPPRPGAGGPRGRAASLQLAGFRVVLIDEVPSAESQSFLDAAGLGAVWYTDRTRRLATAVNNWGTPGYFVLDADARLRYAYTSLDAAGAQLAAIR